MNLLDQIRACTSPGPFYEEDRNDIPLPSRLPIRLIAYYLPQYHRIHENDEWWGKGFTEWTNVTKAVPRYVGHFQPRLPSALGFYDLRMVEALWQQAALAKRHGIGGFCFHYYWFGGRRLLETPLNLLLANPDIDLPFCINWANENWTRTWDGSERHVLMGQAYSPADDIAFAASLEPLIRDRRYIHISGRPLVMLYRPEHLPDAKATMERWRHYFLSRGLRNPYLVMPQFSSVQNPADFGMDAAAGFPPHNVAARITVKPAGLLDPHFRGEIDSYPAMAQNAMNLQRNGYKLFHGVCPSWDNEARRPGRGRSFFGSTPELYGRWLASACRKALQSEDRDERIVFINAWNEWGEGAYLEPDRHFGYAYLRETARVLSRPHLAEAPHTLPDALYTREDSDPLTPSKGTLTTLVRKVRGKIAFELESLAESMRPR